MVHGVYDCVKDYRRGHIFVTRVSSKPLRVTHGRLGRVPVIVEMTWERYRTASSRL